MKHQRPALTRLSIAVTTAVVLSVVLGGCFGTQNVKRYFQLGSPSPETVPRDGVLRLLVEPVKTNHLYDDFRIVYRLSPYQVNYYSYDFWIGKPAELVQHFLVDYFRRCGHFERADDELLRQDPDLVLRSELRVFEEIDEKSSWYARLSMGFELLDYRSGAVVLKYEFDRRRSLPERDVRHLPGAISKMLEQELNRFLQRIREKSETDDG